MNAALEIFKASSVLFTFLLWYILFNELVHVIKHSITRYGIAHHAYQNGHSVGLIARCCILKVPKSMGTLGGALSGVQRRVLSASTLCVGVVLIFAVIFTLLTLFFYIGPMQLGIRSFGWDQSGEYAKYWCIHSTSYDYAYAALKRIARDRNEQALVFACDVIQHANLYNIRAAGIQELLDPNWNMFREQVYEDQLTKILDYTQSEDGEDMLYEYLKFLAAAKNSIIVKVRSKVSLPDAMILNKMSGEEYKHYATILAKRYHNSDSEYNEVRQILVKLDCDKKCVLLELIISALNDMRSGLPQVVRVLKEIDKLKSNIVHGDEQAVESKAAQLYESICKHMHSAFGQAVRLGAAEYNDHLLKIIDDPNRPCHARRKIMDGLVGLVLGQSGQTGYAGMQIEVYNIYFWRLISGGIVNDEASAGRMYQRGAVTCKAMYRFADSGYAYALQELVEWRQHKSLQNDSHENLHDLLDEYLVKLLRENIPECNYDERGAELLAQLSKLRKVCHSIAYHRNVNIDAESFRELSRSALHCIPEKDYRAAFALGHLYATYERRAGSAGDEYIFRGDVWRFLKTIDAWFREEQVNNAHVGRNIVKLYLSFCEQLFLKYEDTNEWKNLHSALEVAGHLEPVEPFRWFTLMQNQPNRYSAVRIELLNIYDKCLRASNYEGITEDEAKEWVRLLRINDQDWRVKTRLLNLIEKNHEMADIYYKTEKSLTCLYDIACMKIDDKSFREQVELRHTASRILASYCKKDPANAVNYIVLRMHGVRDWKPKIEMLQMVYGLINGNSTEDGCAKIWQVIKPLIQNIVIHGKAYSDRQGLPRVSDGVREEAFRIAMAKLNEREKSQLLIQLISQENVPAAVANGAREILGKIGA